MNEYTFDIPAVITAHIHADTEQDARDKAAAFDFVEDEINLSNAGLAGPGTPELTSRDIITVIAARYRPYLVHAYGPVSYDEYGVKNAGRELDAQTDPILDLDRPIKLGRRVLADRDEIREILKRWEDAIGDDGSNDDEHEVGLEMAELLETLISQEGA